MIAIHHRENSFSEHWINYCAKNNIPHKIVNAYADSIIDDLFGCTIFMWNWVYFHSRDILFAKQLLEAAEHMGIKVFPNRSSSLYFDDKLGQKYLFESLNLPIINTVVHYYRKDALAWVKTADFPKVFKLRGGASSDNVWLIKTKKQARRIIKKMFSSGIRSERKSTIIKERYWQFKRDKSLRAFIRLIKGLIRLLLPKEHFKYMPVEKGYVYFQDFIPDNNHDVRIVIIGNRAFGAKRIIRKGDFRASGSGILDYNQFGIDRSFFREAFKINDKLKFQSIAFDFIKKDDEILLIEISYTFPSMVYKYFNGYFTNNGKWVEGPFNPADFMIEDMLKQ